MRPKLGWYEGVAALLGARPSPSPTRQGDVAAQVVAAPASFDTQSVLRQSLDSHPPLLHTPTDNPPRFPCTPTQPTTPHVNRTQGPTQLHISCSVMARPPHLSDRQGVHRVGQHEEDVPGSRDGVPGWRHAPLHTIRGLGVGFGYGVQGLGSTPPHRHAMASGAGRGRGLAHPLQRTCTHTDPDSETACHAAEGSPSRSLGQYVLQA